MDYYDFFKTYFRQKYFEVHDRFWFLEIGQILKEIFQVPHFYLELFILLSEVHSVRLIQEGSHLAEAAWLFRRAIRVGSCPGICLIEVPEVFVTANIKSLKCKVRVHFFYN
jgi:hypothetical protein